MILQPRDLGFFTSRLDFLSFLFFFFLLSGIFLTLCYIHVSSDQFFKQTVLFILQVEVVFYLNLLQFQFHFYIIRNIFSFVLHDASFFAFMLLAFPRPLNTVNV